MGYEYVGVGDLRVGDVVDERTTGAGYGDRRVVEVFNDPDDPSGEFVRLTVSGRSAKAFPRSRVVRRRIHHDGVRPTSVHVDEGANVSVDVFEAAQEATVSGGFLGATTRARRSLDDYRVAWDGLNVEDDEATVVRLLADLRCFAFAEGFDFDAVLERSRAPFHEDAFDERPDSDTTRSR